MSNHALQNHSLAWQITVGFGSLVIIPFIGLLNLLRRIGVFPILATFLGLWLFVGPLLIRGGVTPIGPGDVIWPEDRKAWFALPTVNFILHLWLAGFAIGLPLLGITGLYEYTDHPSKLLRLIKNVMTVIGFVGGLVAFIKVVIIPHMFR